MSPKKPVFKRTGTPEIVEVMRNGPVAKPITDLERTILDNSGGKLDILEVSDQPIGGQLAIEIQAQKLAQVEHLMFQGIRTPHLIAQAIDIGEGLAEQYTKAVLARWQTIGGEVDMKAQRGEALAYMDFLQNQLWSQFTAAKKIVDDQNKIPTERPEGDKRATRNYGAISSAQAKMLNLNAQIIALNAQRTQLYGLTPQAINTMLILGGNEDHEVLVRMRKQEGMKDLAAKLGAILLAKKVKGKVIDLPEQ